MRRFALSVATVGLVVGTCGNPNRSFEDWPDAAVRDAIIYCAAKLPTDYPCASWVLELQENTEGRCRPEALYLVIDNAAEQGVPFTVELTEVFEPSGTFFCDFTIDTGN